jgi:hypothetical protein
MRIGTKDILVVGDRVLIKPDNPEELTKVGLVLPQSVVEKEPVQSGRVLAVGPGIAIPNFAADDSEPWKDHHSGSAIRYIPVQAEIGDYALFLRKEAVEIRYCGEHFVVVPQSAILLLIRDEDLTSTLLEH